MSYQVLARKYRPKNFDTLVGQEHVVRALTHALETGRLHHAYLFTGTRGVGKTTLSRILAKSFNCLGADGTGGITAAPCGVCTACVAIDGGRFVDYIEMDAASNRGVDEMAQLLEQAIYTPSNARFKVYMIDEVHMLTNTAFNAMLKTLEEPPEHIKFILATTDPQKIPVTVLSRCLQFNLKQMPPGHIISHLENILTQESISFELPALRLLAQGAHGSMRDALSLTDQAIAYAAGAVTLDAVQGMLGALDQSFLVRIIDALVQEDGAALLALADEMATRSLSFHAALSDLATLLHRIAVAQAVPNGLPQDWPEREDILRLATLLDAEEVQLFYQIVLHGKQELGLAPDEYAGFSMTLLRMLAFRPQALGQQMASAAVASAAVASKPATAIQRASAPARVAPAAGVAPAAAAPSAPVAGGRPLSPAMAALQAARGAPASTATSAVPMAAPTAPATSATLTAPATPAALSAAPPWASDDDASDGMAQKKTEFAAGQRASLTAQDEPASGAAGPDRSPNLSKTQSDAGAAALRVAEQIAAKAAARAQAVDLPPAPATPAQAVARVVESAPDFVLHPFGTWDGDWPALVVQLPLKGALREFSRQTELLGVQADGAVMQLHLRCPLETLCSAQNVEKLTESLCEHLGQSVRLKTELGRVWHTAHERAEVARKARQREAEIAIENDPFVQSLMREFGATVVPDSVKPVLLEAG